MGTLLIERGIPLTHCFEELNISRADLIAGIHGDYIEAGARIIETNSFGANAVRLARHGLEDRVNEINWTAAQIARQAAQGRDVYVAGSVGPLGISAVEARAQGIDREAVFREQIGALLDGGVHVMLFETFTDAEELSLALYVKQSLHHCPAICLLACPESGRLASGEALGAALQRLADEGAEVVGVNCVSGPEGARRLLHGIPPDLSVAAYPNAGRAMFHEGRYTFDTMPDYFGQTARDLIMEGARIIGGCCGTTPEHIRALSKVLATAHPSKRISVSLPEPPPPAEAAHPEPSILDRIAEGKRVILTEFDPPKNLSLDHYMTGARALTEAGSDVLTLADNSLAILRVSNLALGIRLKDEGILTLLHMSCRDRNLLGLQSDLMGMAAFGMRHVLPLTGDPAKVGDHPGATSVYDVNSISLIEIIRRMNEGFSQAGHALKRAPGFVIGCTFNPNAKNLDAQISRLRRKIEAGAQYIMTQPVFDTDLVTKTAEATKDLGIPVFVGVWPLLNSRQAIFLHNEVPGITVPPDALSRMNGKEGAEGLAAGLDIAREITRAILDQFPGVYLMTPFQRYDTTVELCDYARRI